MMKRVVASGVLLVAAACAPAPPSAEAGSQLGAPPGQAVTQPMPTNVATVPLQGADSKSADDVRQLVLRDVVSDRSGGTYNVYVGIESGQTPPGPDDPRFLGTFSLYDSRPGVPQDIPLAVAGRDKSAALAGQKREITIVGVEPDSDIAAKRADLIP